MKYTQDRASYALRMQRLGLSISCICGRLGITESTLYVWNSKLLGSCTDEAQEKDAPERENSGEPADID